ATSITYATELPLVLENDAIRVTFDPVSGTVTRIRDRVSGIELVPLPGLAENFRLVVLRPDRSTVPILGKDQRLSGVVPTPAGLALRWDGPLIDALHGEHPFTVRMNVEVAGKELRFQLQFDNHTGDKVKEAWYPMIGGLSRFGPPGKPADPVLS